MEERLLIGSNIINLSDIVGIEEHSITLSTTKSKPNPKPKPTKGFLKKLFYCDTVNYTESNDYTYLILKVKAGTQTVIPDKSNDSDTIYIGNASYGTHQLYDFYTIYNDEKFKEQLSEINDPEILCKIGNYRTLSGLYYPDYVNTNMKFDSEIYSNEAFVIKYLD